jgi:hypothetical protein
MQFKSILDTKFDGPMPRTWVTVNESAKIHCTGTVPDYAASIFFDYLRETRMKKSKRFVDLTV